MVFSTLQNAVVTNALKKFTSIGQRTAAPAAPALTVNYSHQIQITIIISHALHVGKNVFFNEFCDFLFQQDDPESKETEISEGTSQSDENGEKRKTESPSHPRPNSLWNKLKNPENHEK